MDTEGIAVQLKDGDAHGAAQLEADEGVHVRQGRILGDIGKYGIVKKSGERRV